MNPCSTPGFRIRAATVRDVDTLPGPDSGICPPGSDCARRAILFVQAYWKAGKRRDFALTRRTGGGG